jgi:hypothetical protein
VEFIALGATSRGWIAGTPYPRPPLEAFRSKKKTRLGFSGLVYPPGQRPYHTSLLVAPKAINSNTQPPAKPSVCISRRRELRLGRMNRKCLNIRGTAAAVSIAPQAMAGKSPLHAGPVRNRLLQHGVNKLDPVWRKALRKT